MIVQTLKIYWALLVTAKKEDKFFFWDNILYSTRTMIEPLVLFIFWSTVAAQGHTVSVGNMAIYFVCFALVTRLAATWISGDMYELITSGKLSTQLLQPIPGSVIAYQQLWELNLKRARLTVTIPATIILLVGMSYFLPIVFPPLSQLAFFPLAIICSIITHFCFWLSIACTALWLKHIEGVVEFIDTIIPFIDGTFIPIIFLKSEIAEILKLLPFRYMISFPLEILSIPLSSYDLTFGTLMSVFWSIVLILISALVWKKGIKLYQG